MILIQLIIIYCRHSDDNIRGQKKPKFIHGSTMYAMIVITIFLEYDKDFRKAI